MPDSGDRCRAYRCVADVGAGGPRGGCVPFPAILHGGHVPPRVLVASATSSPFVYGQEDVGQFMSSDSRRAVRAAGRKQTRGGNLRRSSCCPPTRASCWTFAPLGLGALMVLYTFLAVVAVAHSCRCRCVAVTATCAPWMPRRSRGTVMPISIILPHA